MHDPIIILVDSIQGGAKKARWKVEFSNKCVIKKNTRYWHQDVAKNMFICYFFNKAVNVRTTCFTYFTNKNNLNLNNTVIVVTSET